MASPVGADGAAAHRTDIVEWGPPGQQAFGRFNVKKGEGASKTVWEAYDAKNGNLVAWSEVSTKDLSPEERARVAAEVEVLREVRHERLVDLYASWSTEDKVVLITAICESGDLQRFYRSHDLKLKVVKKLCRQILSGVRYLHSFTPPIIHRDLKCENILYDAAAGSVRIGDLGLSTRVLDSSTCAVLGTPNYMAPELYEGVYNQGVDIYSFGMCVLEMVTKRLPYDECGNAAQMYRKVTQGLLPDAFYRIKYPSVQAFIKYCLTPLAGGAGAGSSSGGLPGDSGGVASGATAVLRPSCEDVLAHPFLDEHAPPAPEDEVAELCWAERAPGEGGSGTGGGGGVSGEVAASGHSRGGEGGTGAEEGSSSAGGAAPAPGDASDANVSFTMAEVEPPPHRRESLVGANSERGSPALVGSGGEADVPRHARGITVEVLVPPSAAAGEGQATGQRRSSSAGVGVGASVSDAAGLLHVGHLLVDDHRGTAAAAGGHSGGWASSGEGVPGGGGGGGGGGSRRGSVAGASASRRASSLPSLSGSRRGSLQGGGDVTVGGATPADPSPSPQPQPPRSLQASPIEPLRYRLPSDGQPEEVLVYAPLPEGEAGQAGLPGPAPSAGAVAGAVPFETAGGAPPPADGHHAGATASSASDGSGFVMQPLGQPLLDGSHAVMEMAPITVYDQAAMDASGTADAVMAVQTGYLVAVSPSTAMSAHAIHDRATDLGGGASGVESGGGGGGSGSGASGLGEAAGDGAGSGGLLQGAEGLVTLGEAAHHHANVSGSIAGGDGASLAATAGGGLVMLGADDARVPASGAGDMTLPEGSGGLTGPGAVGAAPQQPDASGLPSVPGSIRVKLLLDVDAPEAGGGSSAAPSPASPGRRRSSVADTAGAGAAITRASITFDLDPSAVDVVSTALELTGRLAFLAGKDLPPALADVIASFLTTQLFGVRATVTAGPIPGWGIRQLAMWQPRGDEAVPGGMGGGVSSEGRSSGKARGGEHGSHRTSLRGRSRGGGGGGSSAGGGREPLYHVHAMGGVGDGGQGGSSGGGGEVSEGGGDEGPSFPLPPDEAGSGSGLPDPLASTGPVSTAALITTLSPLPEYLLSPEKPRRGRRRSRLSVLGGEGGAGEGGMGGGGGGGAVHPGLSLGGGDAGPGGAEEVGGDGGGLLSQSLPSGVEGEEPYLIIDDRAAGGGGGGVGGGDVGDELGTSLSGTTDYMGVAVTGVSSVGGLVPTLDSVGGLDLLSNVTAVGGAGGYRVPPLDEDEAAASIPGAVVAATTVAAGEAAEAVDASSGAAFTHGATAPDAGLLPVPPPSDASIALPSSVVSHLSPSTASLDASDITPSTTHGEAGGASGLDMSAAVSTTSLYTGGGEVGAAAAPSGEPQRLLLSPSVYAAGAPPSDFNATPSPGPAV